MDVVSSALDLYRQGGFVALPLLLCSLALWYALGYRLQLLRRGSKLPVDALFDRVQAGEEPPRGVLGDALRRLTGESHHPDHIDTVVGDQQAELMAFGGAVAGVVAVAPLLGLLGTVNGMIETFDSLASMALFTRGGGIAAGVSEALFSTQMGLVVAIPGAIVGRLLLRAQERLTDELAELGRRSKELA